MLTRRALLSGAAFITACGRQRGSGFDGFVYIASELSKTIVSVDLTAFSIAHRTAMEEGPSVVTAHAGRAAVYALTPKSGTVWELDPATLAVRRQMKVLGVAEELRYDAATDRLWVLGRESRQLAALDPEAWRVDRRIKLPGVAGHVDFSRERRAAVTFPAEARVAVVNLDAGTIEHSAQTGAGPNAVAFRSDGRQVLTGNRGDRTVSVIDAASGRAVVQLPVAMSPETFCMKADGGSLFVTGAGLDAVAMIFPYRSAVAETVLAGRSPGAMAASGTNLLCVANTEAGDVTLIDITTVKAVAVVSVGAHPGFITFTPDDQYALVLNRESGDLAVIRLGALRGPRTRGAPPPLFTMIPVGLRPVSAVVRAA